MLSALFKTLGLTADDEARHETETVAGIATVLKDLPPERARLLAAFAYLLGRVAFADHDVSDDERAVMESRLATEGDVTSLPKPTTNQPSFACTKTIPIIK